MASTRIALLAAALALGASAVASTEASALTNRYTGDQAPGFLGLLFGDDGYDAPYAYERPIHRPYRPYGPGPYRYDDRGPPPPPYYDGY